MSEYKVMRNGKLWSDRLNSKWDADEEIIKSIEEWYDGDYKVEEMTKEDMKKYINNK